MAKAINPHQTGEGPRRVNRVDEYSVAGGVGPDLPLPLRPAGGLEAPEIVDAGAATEFRQSVGPGGSGSGDRLEGAGFGLAIEAVGIQRFRVALAQGTSEVSRSFTGFRLLVAAAGKHDQQGYQSQQYGSGAG